MELGRWERIFDDQCAATGDMGSACIGLRGLHGLRGLVGGLTVRQSGALRWYLALLARRSRREMLEKILIICSLRMDTKYQHHVIQARSEAGRFNFWKRNLNLSVSCE
jgi:hypothetical protein